MIPKRVTRSNNVFQLRIGGHVVRNNKERRRHFMLLKNRKNLCRAHAWSIINRDEDLFLFGRDREGNVRAIERKRFRQNARNSDDGGERHDRETSRDDDDSLFHFSPNDQDEPRATLVATASNENAASSGPAPSAIASPMGALCSGNWFGDFIRRAP
jgi:hypothetical protein